MHDPLSPPRIHAAGDPGGMSVWTLSGDWRAPALPDWPELPAHTGAGHSLKLRADGLRG